MSKPIVAVLLLFALAAPGFAAPPGPPEETGFEWQRSTPEAQGVDSEMLLRSLGRIRDEGLDVRSLMIVRNDHVILELYVHPYGPDTVHNVKSVSKSVLSALVGIALREDVLADVDQPVRDFFPAYFPEDAGDERNDITLRHLLTMTSGLDLDENGPKMQRVFASNDWIRTTFDTEMAAAPGTRFVYSTPLTHTMVGVLTEASGAGVLEFANEHLFGPLDFGALQWTRGPRGYYFGGSELFLRTSDMAKFGQLYLHNGTWNGGQIVPAAWVAESTADRLPDGSRACYGYWWWIKPDGSGFAARGWGGQGIAVQTGLRMVIAGTAGDHGASDRMFRDFDPAALTNESLPPNPDAVAELEALVRELANPTPNAVPPLPPVAALISGRTFALEGNARDLREITFVFTPGASESLVASKRGGETYETAVGLDGVYRLSDTGAGGPMPEGNQVALRGRWAGEDTFEMHMHRVGDPVSAMWVIRFDGDLLQAEVEILPTGNRITLSGATAPDPRVP